MMRSPLSRMEHELGASGFLHTDRSWLVNATLVTALRSAGPGGYTLAPGSLTVPVSRGFPVALATLRGGFSLVAKVCQISG